MSLKELLYLSDSWIITPEQIFTVTKLQFVKGKDMSHSKKR